MPSGIAGSAAGGLLGGLGVGGNIAGAMLNAAPIEGPSSELPEIIGLPPFEFGDVSDFPGHSDCEQNDVFTKCVFPKLILRPAVQEFANGLEYFTLNTEDGWSKYKAFLLRYGFKPNENKPYMVFCYQNLAPFSETYSNEFGQSTLVGGLNVLGEGAREVMWVAGEDIKKGWQEAQQGKKGELAQQVVEGLGEMGAQAQGLLNTVVGEKRGTQITNLAGQLLSGGKLNFPMVWKSSSFDREYDISIRLWNICPDNIDMQNKYIIGSLYSLLPFVVPTSEDGATFKWPLLCTIQIPGQSIVKACYVKTVSVIRGGDANDVAWNQRVGTIDIKIAFGDLYTTMLDITGTPMNPTSPNLNDMVTVMRSKENTYCCNRDLVTIMPSLNTGTVVDTPLKSFRTTSDQLGGVTQTQDILT